MAKKDKSKSAGISAASSAGPTGLGKQREKSKLFPTVSAKNDCQKQALRALANPESHITYINGIAGTGKTYIAVSWGLEQLIKGRYDKIIFTRPVVEAGENLGYLPGSFDMKLAPFMIPIMDVLHEQMSAHDVKTLVEEAKIITLPLAYMRGVTFKNAFVVLDEAQNTTPKQMHLFVTRIGENSKIVVTGDTKQSDIRGENGFTDAIQRLDGAPGIEIVELDPTQVIRHPMIAEIDRRYETLKGFAPQTRKDQ
jgi:phosphate starvation-inducible PhoH-like protein